jgi:hypothetical protein
MQEIITIEQVTDLVEDTSETLAPEEGLSAVLKIYILQPELPMIAAAETNNVRPFMDSRGAINQLDNHLGESPGAFFIITDGKNLLSHKAIFSPPNFPI